jgi:hypothetical protein
VHEILYTGKPESRPSASYRQPAELGLPVVVRCPTLDRAGRHFQRHDDSPGAVYPLRLLHGDYVRGGRRITSTISASRRCPPSRML